MRPASGDHVVYAPGHPPYPGNLEVWTTRRHEPSLVMWVGDPIGPRDPGHNVQLLLLGDGGRGDLAWWASEHDLRVVRRAVYVDVDAPDEALLAGSTVALDFDGPIHSYRRGWTGYVPEDPPAEGALEFVRRLVAAGARVVVHTSRADSPHGRREVSRYLERHGFPLVEVTYEKVPAACYVDDRAVLFDPRRGYDDVLLAEVVRMCGVRHGGEAHPTPRRGWALAPGQDEAALARRLEGELLAGLPHTSLEEDTTSSASRQHYIDTGEYLPAGEQAQ